MHGVLNRMFWDVHDLQLLKLIIAQISCSECGSMASDLSKIVIYYKAGNREYVL
jgi:hypothetical protein